MSAKQRAAAEALRAKYSRVFGVPKVYVEIEYEGDEDARVFARRAAYPRLPVWTLGATPSPSGGLCESESSAFTEHSEHSELTGEREGSRERGAAR